MEGNKQGRKTEDSGGIIPQNIWLQFALFSAIFLILGLLASVLFLKSAPAPSWDFGEESSKLQKTSDLQILGAESYQYQLLFENQTQTIFLTAKYGSNCPGVILEDVKNSYELCIRQSGFYSNSSEYLGDFSFPFYAPWMLYIHENFSWKPNRTITVFPTNITQRAQLFFETKNKTTISGREAYEIYAHKLSSPSIFADDFFANTTYFVDAQKRVLLAATSGGAQIILVSAPFELEK